MTAVAIVGGLAASEDRGDSTLQGAESAQLAVQDARHLLAEPDPASELFVERATGIADALHSAGDDALHLEEWKLARECYSLEVQLLEIVRPGSPQLGDGLIGLGAALGFALSDPEPGREAFRRALEVHETADPQGLGVAHCHSWWADHEFNHDRYEAAREHLLISLEIFRQLVPGSIDEFKALRNIGNAEYWSGLWDEAADHYGAAVRLGEQLDRTDVQLRGPLWGLGFVSVVTGDFDAAREYFERVVHAYETTGSDPVELARALINLGHVPTELQHYGEARRIYERAVSLLEEHAPDHIARAKALSNLSEVAVRQGDNDAAERYALAALPVFEEQMPESIQGSMVLVRLGNIANNRGRYDEGKAYHQKALAIREGSGPDYLVAESLFFLAESEIGLGSFDVAWSMDHRALELLGGIDDCCDMTQAQIVNELGLLARQRGEFELSEEFLELAALSWREYGGPTHPMFGASLLDLAGTLTARGRYSEALQKALEAHRIETEHVRLTARLLPEREGVRYALESGANDVLCHCWRVRCRATGIPAGALGMRSSSIGRWCSTRWLSETKRPDTPATKPSSKNSATSPERAMNWRSS